MLLESYQFQAWWLGGGGTLGICGAFDTYCHRQILLCTVLVQVWRTSDVLTEVEDLIIFHKPVKQLIKTL